MKRIDPSELAVWNVKGRISRSYVTEMAQKAQSKAIPGTKSAASRLALKGAAKYRRIRASA